jgi:hypothetical protein
VNQRVTSVTLAVVTHGTSVLLTLRTRGRVRLVDTWKTGDRQLGQSKFETWLGKLTNEVVPCGPYVGFHVAPWCWLICFEKICEFMGFDLETSRLG